MNDEFIYLNGIDGVTGNYLVRPLPLAEAVSIARGQPPDRTVAGWLSRVRDVLRRPFQALPMDVDPTNVAKAGWAVVFPANTTPEVQSALEPLLAHRKGQVLPERFKVLDYRPGESLKDWLRRHKVATGSISPTKVPYYVTLVGDPTLIPLEFQYLLDIEYAVGRIVFDSVAHYRQYAESVVAYETAGHAPNAKEIVYWGPRHKSDRATQLSADYLLAPLTQGIPASGDQAEEPAISEVFACRSRCFIGDLGTKANLAEVLHATDTALPPAMLFTASHGMGWPKGDKRQRATQGALLCQDWTGLGSIHPGHYLPAAEITDDARVHGIVAFLFACYSAGTPALDNYLINRSGGSTSIAEQPFIAALPQRLLSHPNGGALAVIGHIERAWGYSIQPAGVGPQLVPFRNLIGRILSGEPVGHATKDFSERYATLSAALLSALDETQHVDQLSNEELAWMWVERNDAQNYVVLGDPAVQVRVELLR